MPKSERNIISAQMEDILNAMPDGVFISDVDGTTLFVNRIYEQLTGFTLGELRGRQVRDIVAEGGFDLILNPEIVREGKPVSRVQTLRNGKKLMLSGIPVFDKNGSISLVCTFARDITMLDAMRDKLDEQHRQIRQIQASYTQIEEEQQRSAQPIIESSAMHGVMRFISQVAATDATLLLLGETGVGKDVFARHAHNISPRKDGPFLKIDCGGISESLIEAEMFGYEPGSFTGASQKGKAGYFEQARGGTVFLDEVGELSMPMQTRLLRVLQDGEFGPCGRDKGLPHGRARHRRHQPGSGRVRGKGHLPPRSLLPPQCRKRGRTSLRERPTPSVPWPWPFWSVTAPDITSD